MQVFDAACKIVLQKVKSGKVKVDRRNGLGLQVNHFFYNYFIFPAEKKKKKNEKNYF